MISPTTLDFLRKLSRNNNREWFNAHRDEYLTAKADVERLSMELVAGVRAFDGSIGELEPKECMFRIYRDARFSRDKSPYKTNMGIVVQRGGKKSPYACYYAHIEPNACFLSGGVYMPDPPTLKALRRSIDVNAEEFLEIIAEKNFRSYFAALADESKLVKVPQGFDKNSPVAEYLKYKDFYVMRGVTEEELCSKSYVKQTLQAFKALKPLNDFFNAAMDEA